MALEVELDMMVTKVTLVAVLVMVLGTQVEALTQVQTLAAAVEVLAGLVVLAVTVAGTVELEELVEPCADLICCEVSPSIAFKGPSFQERLLMEPLASLSDIFWPKAWMRELNRSLPTALMIVFKRDSSLGS